MSACVTDQPDSTLDTGEPMLGMDLPAAPPPATTGGAYRVLARKYRPQKFSELIGQDAMVQTLANAIRRDRLAHAFLMTGVRGVGKTSTARLIAKGLNCTGPDGSGGPTIDPCGVCDACIAIAEGRHIDVIEMDAASHTGVDDVREIIEAVRYAAVSARYKIYIIDEVHMLSKNAFNALLKTLEEPPEHVKFLFATTEVNKVPVTVLSRCQRFDLRRITPDLLFDHFSLICTAEAVEAEDQALRMIASAAEGSVRDGLSILDQAIAHADLDGLSRVTAAQVQDMLGLSDGGTTRNLFTSLLGGEAGVVIDAVRSQYALGVEPLAMIRGLMRIAHGIALHRVARGDDPADTPEDRAAIAAWAGQMGMARVQRLWQLLLKAHDEVARAGDPLEATEMALLRIVHAGSLPDPDELARLLREGQGAVPPAAAAPAAAPGAEPAAMVSAPSVPVLSVQATTPPPAREPAAVAASAAPALAEDDDPDSWRRDAEDDADGTVVPFPGPYSRGGPVAEQPAAPLADPLSIEGLAQALTASGALMQAAHLRREGRLVAIEPGVLTLSSGPQMHGQQVEALARALTSALAAPWRVALSDTPGAPTVAEQAAAVRQAEDEALRQHPLVAATLQIFPDAQLIRPGADGGIPGAPPALRSKRS